MNERAGLKEGAPGSAVAPQGLDYRRLFESIPGLYLILSPDLHIVAVSDAYLKATLTTRDHILGRGIFDVFPDNPDDPTAAGVQNLRASLERVKARLVPDSMPVQRYDVRRPDADGGGFEEKFWSPVNSPMIAEGGELAYIIHRVEDVTEFVRLRQRGNEHEQQTLDLRLQAEKMETEVYQRTRQVAETSRQLKEANAELDRLYKKTQELDQLKSEFFANVSHELRTPLALILDPVKQLCASGDAPEPMRRELEMVLRNARILLRHVNDLLDLSKLEAGQMTLQSQTIDVAEFVRLCAAHFEAVASEQQIDYLVQAPGPIDARVDPEKLQGVILNLLSNAFKFTPRGGTVRCSLARSEDPIPSLSLEVADSGPGIPPELREVVFERFRQLEGGTTRRVGGTGLGLAIAREFAQLHGGTLRVQSAAEGGASFCATFPYRRDETSASSDARRAVGAPGHVPPPMATATGFDAARASETALAHVAALNAARRPAATSSLGRSHAPSASNDGRRDVPLVLVVEDNPEMNAFISGALTSSYHVAIAFDGRAGLERALALRPSVIIADLMMPEVDGASMLRHLRRRPDFATTPILILTAKADEELRIRMLREGAQDVLVKPFALEELKARIENLTTSRKLAPLAEANAQLAESFRSTRLELERAYTELRTTQEQLGQTAKMASLGQLMADIAHELSEPLALVQGHLEAGRHDLGGAAAEAAGEPRRERFHLAQDRLRQAGAGLERIRELVSKLRMFSRPDAGERRRVSVRECVESTLAILDHRLGDRISVDVDLDAVDVIDCYPALLNQALMNLLANSIAAISDKGRIAVTSHWASDGYRIEVRDSGQGIPDELRDRVFEPFFTTRPIGHGTGLGLSITDSIIKKHGGRIEIAAAEGGGTRVILHFPPVVAGATVRSSGAQSSFSEA